MASTLARMPLEEVREIVNGFGAPAFVADVEPGGVTRFLLVNDVLEQATQMANALFAGKTPHQCLAPESANFVATQHRACIDHRQALEYEEYHHLPVGPTWWRTVLVPLFDEQEEEVVRLLGTSIDITATKQALVDLQESHAQLRRTNESLEQFVNIAAHDLKAPLYNVKFIAEMIHDDVDRRDMENLIKNTERMSSVVQDSIELLDDLVQYAHLEKTNERPHRYYVGHLVENAISLLKPNAGFAVEFIGENVAVTAVWTPLSTVLQYLIDNAIKHHDRDRGRVTIGARLQEGALELTIADDGPGIPPRYREKIFQPFRRLSATGRSGGRGMGLAVVKRLVELQGGMIDVTEPRNGPGAVFRVNWPTESVHPGPPHLLLQGTFHGK